MKPLYNWAIIGTGNIANKFATALQSTTRGRLWAVASRNMQRAVDFATRYGASRPYNDYELLFNDPEVDVVYIATPHHLHVPLSKAAIGAGKAVLCEKPMSITAQQAQEVINLSRQKKVFFMEGLWTLFLPHLAEVTRLVNSGKIGELLTIRANFGFQKEYDPTHRLFDPQLGGGSLLDVGIYPLFLSQYFFGKPTHIAAQARLSELKIDLSLQAILNYENGKQALINSSIETLQPIEVELFGTQGGVRIKRPWFRPTSITWWDNSRNENSLTPAYEGNGYNYEAEAVMNNLDNNLLEDPIVNHEFSLTLSRTMEIIQNNCGIVYPKTITKL